MKAGESSSAAVKRFSMPPKLTRIFQHLRGPNTIFYIAGTLLVHNHSLEYTCLSNSRNRNVVITENLYNANLINSRCPFEDNNSLYISIYLYLLLRNLTIFIFNKYSQLRQNAMCSYPSITVQETLNLTVRK